MTSHRPFIDPTELRENPLEPFPDVMLQGNALQTLTEPQDNF